MKKNLIVALSAAFIFNVANISDAAANNVDKVNCGFTVYSSGAPQKSVDRDSDDYNSRRDCPRNHDNDNSSKNRRQPPPPQYDPKPAPPFLTDKQKKNWRKQEAEREKWFDEARTRWQRENQPSSRK